MLVPTLNNKKYDIVFKGFGRKATLEGSAWCVPKNFPSGWFTFKPVRNNMSELQNAIYIFQIPTFKDCGNLWRPYDL
jgi:hypothetical protein